MTKSEKTIIHTSWQTYLFIIGLPIFLIAMDLISAIMSHSSSGIGILNAAGVIFLTVLIFGSCVVVVSDQNIVSWPSLLLGKITYIKDIYRIEVRVETRHRFNMNSVIPTVFPNTALYFLDKDLKKIGKISLTTLSKESTVCLLNKIQSINPNILLNDEAEELKQGVDSLVKKQSTKILSDFLKYLLLPLFFDCASFIGDSLFFGNYIGYSLFPNKKPQVMRLSAKLP